VTSNKGLAFPSKFLLSSLAPTYTLPPLQCLATDLSQTSLLAVLDFFLPFPRCAVSLSLSLSTLIPKSRASLFPMLKPTKENPFKKKTERERRLRTGGFMAAVSGRTRSGREC
jgi:hypothetical protein